MLKARPTHLLAAVESLPVLKGTLPSGVLRIQEQRERLLAIPADKVERYRINPRALEILPALATMRRDTELRERVIALAAAQASQMLWPTIARLMPWIYESAVFRKRVYSRARREVPRAPLPMWLVAHWREALGRDDPATLLAHSARHTEPVLARLPGYLQLPVGSPLADRVLSVALADRGDDWLDSQPYTETLRFIESSSASPTTRAALLRRILTRYGVQPRTPSALTPAHEELFAVADQLLQGSALDRPGAWRGVPAAAHRVARWSGLLRALQSGFGTTDPRVTSWRRWLRHISHVEQVGEGIIGVQVGLYVFAEPREASRVCRVYPHTVWKQHCERQAAASQRLAPPRPEARLSVDTDRQPIDAYIKDRLGLRM